MKIYCVELGRKLPVQVLVSAELDPERVRALFAWVSRALAGDERSAPVFSPVHCVSPGWCSERGVAFVVSRRGIT